MEPLCLIVMTNYGFAAFAVSIFLLDHGLTAFTWLSLLDDSSTVTVAITIVRLADGYASTDGTDANTNFVRKRGSRDGNNHGGHKQRFLFYPPILTLGNVRAFHLFRQETGLISAGGAELDQWLRTRQGRWFDRVGQQAPAAARWALVRFRAPRHSQLPAAGHLAL